MPYLPLSIFRENKSVETLALVDTGATVNVLPYQIGIELGAVWEEQPTLFRLDGNLANYESGGLILNTEIRGFMPVKLAFAWTKAKNVPVILGQVDFFQEFDICFFRSNQIFEVKPK
ncbi:MAG: retroviral-like aspartic protease [Aridibacter sp.]